MTHVYSLEPANTITGFVAGDNKFAKSDSITEYRGSS